MVECRDLRSQRHTAVLVLHVGWGAAGEARSSTTFGSIFLFEWAAQKTYIDSSGTPDLHQADLGRSRLIHNPNLPD